MRRLDGVAGVEAAVGEDLGAGPWLTVSQETVTDFAAVTGDRQWIHVDADRAARGPFGGTIAHGYLTLSLLPQLLRDVLSYNGFTMVVNYGVDRVRFPSPVLVGSRVRARAELRSVERTARGARVVLRASVEVDGSDKAACVADTVTLLVV